MTFIEKTQNNSSGPKSPCQRASRSGCQQSLQRIFWDVGLLVLADATPEGLDNVELNQRLDQRVAVLVQQRGKFCDLLTSRGQRNQDTKIDI